MAPFFTPAMMDAKINAVEIGMTQMLPIITGSERAPTDFKIGFQSFAKEWISFHDSLNFVNKTLSSTWDAVQNYERRMFDWSNKAAKLGISTYVDEPSQKGSSFSIPWWGWVGAVGFVLYNMHPLRTAHSVRSLIPSKKSHKKKNR